MLWGCDSRTELDECEHKYVNVCVSILHTRHEKPKTKRHYSQSRLFGFVDGDWCNYTVNMETCSASHKQCFCYRMSYKRQDRSSSTAADDVKHSVPLLTIHYQWSGGVGGGVTVRRRRWRNILHWDQYVWSKSGEEDYATEEEEKVGWDEGGRRSLKESLGWWQTDAKWLK